MSFVRPVNDWLKASYNIHVNTDWLSTCIEFINQETQNSQPRLDDLRRHVLEQWLVSDLSEIGEPLIPDEVLNNDKCHLHNVYPLQMISAVDVSTPLYGQIQKLKSNGKELEAGMITFSDAPFEHGANQTYGNNPKPSRMLKLELTDGHRNIEAMEYRPIKALKADLSPGTKILIKGTVLCRRQMLLLEEDNVSVMGGEVDDLIVVNNPLTNLETEMEKNRTGAVGVADP